MWLAWLEVAAVLGVSWYFSGSEDVGLRQGVGQTLSVLGALMCGKTLYTYTKPLLPRLGYLNKPQPSMWLYVGLTLVWIVFMTLAIQLGGPAWLWADGAVRLVVLLAIAGVIVVLMLGNRTQNLFSESARTYVRPRAAEAAPLLALPDTEEPELLQRMKNDVKQQTRARLLQRMKNDVKQQTARGPLVDEPLVDEPEKAFESWDDARKRKRTEWDRKNALKLAAEAAPAPPPQTRFLHDIYHGAGFHIWGYHWK